MITVYEYREWSLFKNIGSDHGLGVYNREWQLFWKISNALFKELYTEKRKRKNTDYIATEQSYLSYGHPVLNSHVILRWYSWILKSCYDDVPGFPSHHVPGFSSHLKIVPGVLCHLTIMRLNSQVNLRWCAWLLKPSYDDVPCVWQNYQLCFVQVLLWGAGAVQ